jgi:hypothetical protein
MKTYRGVDVYIHFLDLGTSWGWVTSFTPRPLYPWERAPGNHYIGGWVYPRAALDDIEKSKFLTLPGLKLQHLGCPAHSQLLYQLHYPGSNLHKEIFKCYHESIFFSIMAFIIIHLKQITSQNHSWTEILYKFTSEVTITGRSKSRAHHTKQLYFAVTLIN